MRTFFFENRLRIALVALPLLLAVGSCSIVEDRDGAMDPSGFKLPVFTEELSPLPEPVPFKTVYFETDKSDLTAAAKTALRFNADWLKKHPDVNAQIEGQCDERGSRDYNVALGEHRAEAAKAYLVQLGIDESRLNAVSNGKIPGHASTLMAQNRQVSFTPVYPPPKDSKEAPAAPMKDKNEE
jgi:peptidoglycan-associated lipoprotein